MPQSNNNSLSETAILSFMNRALQLAQLGAGAVSPNPMVGCVIVHQGTIVGEGWHQRYGDWHAEVNAVNDVADKSILSESEVFYKIVYLLLLLLFEGYNRSFFALLNKFWHYLQYVNLCR